MIAVSNRWLNLTGQTLPQALDGGWLTVSHPDDLSGKIDIWKRSLATGEPYDASNRVRMANGEYRWMRARAFARRDAAGAIIRWYGSSEDIHERWTAEEALRQSEARLDSAVTIAALGMFEWDLKTNRVHLSDRFREIYSLAREDPVTAERVFAAILPEDLPGVRAALAAAPIATGRIEIEYRVRRADNAVRDIVSLSKLVRDADGEAISRVGVVVDVTERKQNERMLKELNETLEQRIAERTAERNRMWQLSADIMLVARFDGAIIAVNPAWTAVLGWTEKELVGGNFLQLAHPDDFPESLARIESCSEGSLVFRSETRYRHKDGSYRWIAWAAVPGPDLIHAVGRDCTADREKAEALNLAEEQLRQAQKMEAVGQLTGGLAHDFNNMLQGITGTLELLGTRIAQGRFKDLERYIDAAQEASKRAAALTHRLLAFSRRQTLDPKPTNIHRLVIGMEELIRRAMGPAIDIEMVGTAGLWTALVDPNQLENALLNLCINARHAMPDGGRLTIETANQWLEQRAAGELTPGQYLTLSVRDTGIGMTPEVVKRAFDPFFTTKPIGVGTGLGLSMIYGFARQSSGQVQIESQVGKGTTVRLYLPRHPGEEAAVEAHGEPADAPRAEQGETVLVVDDEPIVRMLATEVLEELGYRSIEAGDGAAALQILRSNLRIDLLVTDVGLPGGMNGRQVADAGRALRPGLKVLFITGYAENAGLSNGTLEPGMQVLTKPFAMDVLGSRIKALIARA